MTKFCFISVLLLVLSGLLYSQDFNAEIVNKESLFEVIDHSLVNTETLEIEINNRKGVGFCNVQIGYQEGDEIEIIYAYIKDREGNIIREYKEKEFIERSEFNMSGFYSDYHVMELLMNHNVYPYYVCYSYRIVKSRFFYIDSWSPVESFAIPTYNASLKVIVPAGYKIKYELQNIDSPVIDSLDNTLIYCWNVKNTTPVIEEVRSPAILGLIPIVNVFPELFYFAGEGSFRNWKSFGVWVSNILKDKSELTEKEKVKIKEATYGVESEYEKIRLLYHYLQDNTRYINVTVETGGLIPYPAEYVCHNKYGDCKALTNYFKSVLNYVDIDSYYTKVYAGEKNIKFNLDSPSQFSNHIILSVPLKNDTLWLDCTSSGPFNYLGTFTQGRYAFVINDTESYLRETPSLQQNDVLNERNFLFRYLGNGNSLASVVMVNRGVEFEELSYLNSGLNTKDKQNYIESAFSISGYELDSFKFENIDRDSKQIEIKLYSKSSNHFKTYGDELIVEMPDISLDDFENPCDRKLPVQYFYPVFKIDSISVDYPDGYYVRHIPEPISIESKFGSFVIENLIDGNSILLIRKLIINKSIIDLSEYHDFYQFINDVKDLINGQYFVFKRS